MNLKLLLTPKLEKNTGTKRLFEASQAHCIVGRADSHLVVEDAKCSRQHCLFYEGFDGKLRVRDLESRNGTFVNGIKCSESILQNGDEVRAGSTLIKVLDFAPSSDRAIYRSTKSNEQESNENTGSIDSKAGFKLANPDILNSWPNNVFALPKQKQVDFVEYVEADGTQIKLRLDELLKLKQSRTE